MEFGNAGVDDILMQTLLEVDSRVHCMTMVQPSLICNFMHFAHRFFDGSLPSRIHIHLQPFILAPLGQSPLLALPSVPRKRSTVLRGGTTISVDNVILELADLQTSHKEAMLRFTEFLPPSSSGEEI